MEPILMEETRQEPLPASFEPGKYDEISDSRITRRFARLKSEPKALTYEFTRDPGYLHQYYRLREEMFINIWGLENFNGSKDAYDDNSEIVIARIGNLVVGGCRMTFTSMNDYKKLPLEKDDFDLRSAMPQLFKGNRPIVEISRLAILPEYQNSMVMLEICRDMLKMAVTKHAAYGVSVAPLALARNYRKVMFLFGLEWEIQRKVQMPEREEYEGIKMAFSVMDLAPLYATEPVVSGKREVVFADDLAVA